MVYNKLFSKLVFLSVLAGSAVFADTGQMEYLGKTQLGNFFSDSDTIDFGQCNGPHNDYIYSIQLRVEKNDVEIDSLVLQFGNGETSQIAIRSEFQEGSSSRVIDLPGSERCVRKAYIRGRTLGFGSQGTVLFYGFRYKHSNPNILLGSTYLEFERDADHINVSACKNGNFRYAKAIQIQVTQNDAQIEELRIRFGNGEVIEVPLRDYFKSGSWSNIKDLPGNTRCIKEIFIIGRTSPQPPSGPRALVKAYGLN